MRARLAIASSGVQVELREIVLRDKPKSFLEASASGTVPCLLEDGTSIDESLDIMTWALAKSDPQGWLDMPKEGWDLISECDMDFKSHLDKTKYASRYPDSDAAYHRQQAMLYLRKLNAQINSWIFSTPSIADFAILPFVRQFALIDRPEFDACDLENVKTWLDNFLDSSAFLQIMTKYERWEEETQGIVFLAP